MMSPDPTASESTGTDGAGAQWVLSDNRVSERSSGESAIKVVVGNMVLRVLKLSIVRKSSMCIRKRAEVGALGCFDVVRTRVGNEPMLDPPIYRVDMAH